MDWLVTNAGECKPLFQASRPSQPTECYRLYRLLTDLEDILSQDLELTQQLAEIVPLVRRLLTESYWWQVPDQAPDPELGWAVQSLYDEPFFDLTVQLVTWLPGASSPIHNHGTWAVIAMISGAELNQFWQNSQQIQLVGEQTFTAGEILALMPQVIHQVSVCGEEPTISLNIYGKADYDARLEFDPLDYRANPY
ncbi:MAG: cupin [Pseudanabaenaceae cyanobacterium bins.68]|nr:cupin [Pseudanabaenaceae cyanobacterium bins.68]